MRYLLIVLSLMVCSIVHAKEQDNNIISVVIGEGPSGLTDRPATSSSSSTTSCSSPGESDCHGNSGHSSTTNTVTNSGTNSAQHRDAVTGLMYQRRIENSPLLMGVLIQSNETYSVIMGVSF